MRGVLELARSLEMLAVAANPDRQEIGRVWGELKASCVNACEELYALLLSRSDRDAHH
jgi:hypothetical protein